MGCYPLFNKFKFVASRNRSTGKLIVSSEEVFTLQISTQPWDKGEAETIWKAVPMGIKVETKLKNSKSVTEVRFWITPTQSLNPVMLITNDWRGHRRVKRHHVKRFKLDNGLKLKFDHHFDFDKDKDGNDVIKSHMVAVTDFKKETKASTKLDTPLLRELDDFLLIAGLALRTRSYSYGWQAFDTLGITKSFRGDVRWPSRK